jgi:hypothetical protein
MPVIRKAPLVGAFFLGVAVVSYIASHMAPCMDQALLFR